MNTNITTSLWQQAHTARSSGNWSLLIQCLQEQLANKGTTESSPTQVQLLDLCLEVLAGGDFQERWEIAKVLPKLGESAIAPLIAILEDEDPDEELCWYAARLLGEFNHPAAVTALVELLKSTQSEELRAMAAGALGNIGVPAIAALTELLVDEETRILAVRALSFIRCSETIAPLLSVTQDPQVAVRAAAIEALSSFHDSRIPPVLLNALNDLAASVRRAAVIGLSFRSDLKAELDLVNRLIPHLYDFNLEVCQAASIALGRLGTDAAAAALFQVLQSAHTPVALQIEIVRALGWMESLTSLQYLHDCLNQSQPSTLWQETVTVLGRLEQPDLKTRAAAILIKMLKSAHPATQLENIKQAIALSLGQLGDTQAIEPLITLLAVPNQRVRLHVIAALKQLAPVIAYEQLQQLSTFQAALTPQLKQGVVIALQEWSHQS